jgi:hypothetical protein
LHRAPFPSLELMRPAACQFQMPVFRLPPARLSAEYA